VDIDGCLFVSLAEGGCMRVYMCVCLYMSDSVVYASVYVCLSVYVGFCWYLWVSVSDYGYL